MRRSGEAYGPFVRASHWVFLVSLNQWVSSFASLSPYYSTKAFPFAKCRGTMSVDSEPDVTDHATTAMAVA